MISPHRESWKENTKNWFGWVSVQLISQTPTHTHTHKDLEGQPSSLCDSILSFFSSKDEPILLLISPKPVLKSFKSIMLSFFPLLLLKKQSRNPSACSWHLVTITLYGRMFWWQGRLTTLRNTGVTEPKHALHNQPYFYSWLFLKTLWLHHEQGHSLC